LALGITAVTWSTIVLAVATVVLVAVTYFYVRLTKGILNETSEYVELTRGILAETAAQSKLQYSPVIGITVDKMWISNKTQAEQIRDFAIYLTLLNLGNSPAIEIYVDGEIVLQHVEVHGYSEMPSRFWPCLIPFLKPDESVTEGADKRFSPVFGYPCIQAMFEDWKHCFDEERWQTVVERVKEENDLNLWQRFNQVIRQPVLRIIVYYRNHLDQHFKSLYEIPLLLDQELTDDAIEVREAGVPMPKFYAAPIAEAEMKEEMAEREIRRKYSDVRNV